ncbi:hypothetical protein VP1G_11221 [Cytospora mali]|uniref:F-box domain-containing protein n=1 Tax=Cytospora mali TaxID=578113 RepID=A0A194VBH4_CYTMA|nr:hypothetical protein VP1G_11221 [Valsa mali var. pyri (nom. inval.)]
MPLNFLQSLLELIFPPGHERHSTPLLDEPQDDDERQHGDDMPPQPPPSYSDVFSSSLNPDRQSYTPPSEWDPLVIAALHNQTYSPLHWLPDYILVRIIHILDSTGIECLRRSGRRFPPLCVNIVLGRPRTYLSEGDDETGPFKWPRFVQMCHSGQANELMRVAEGLDGLSGDNRTQLRRLLDRDRYCDDCREGASSWRQRAGELRKYLHCSVCDADHPACLFSGSQRLEQAHRRYCIGHEGYLRICSHEEGIVRWKDLLEIERNKANKAPRAETYLQCKHSSHILLCTGTRMEEGGVLGSKCGSCPSACVYPMFHLIENTINLSWTAHLPLRRDEWPLTAAALRPQLAELRDNAGRFICPALAAGVGMDLPELCCFDPNNCDCVRFKGSENAGWQLWSGLDSNPGGHTDPAKRLFLPEDLIQPGPECEFALRRHENTGSGYIGAGRNNVATTTGAFRDSRGFFTPGSTQESVLNPANRRREFDWTFQE